MVWARLALAALFYYYYITITITINYSHYITTTITINTPAAAATITTILLPYCSQANLEDEGVRRGLGAAARLEEADLVMLREPHLQLWVHCSLVV